MSNWDHFKLPSFRSMESLWRNLNLIMFAPSLWKSYVCYVTYSIFIIFLRPGPTTRLLGSRPNHAHCHVTWYSPSTSHILWYDTHWTNYWALRKRYRRGGHINAPSNFWFNLLPFWGNVNTLQHTFPPLIFPEFQLYNYALS